MNIREVQRSFRVSDAVLALGASVALAFVIGISAEMRFRHLALAGAALGGLGLAAFCGNVRLFCLYMLVVTSTLNASKTFGPYIPKLGGETGFRVELADPFWLALLAFQIADIRNRTRAGIRIPKLTYVWLLIMATSAAVAVFGPWTLSAAQELVRMCKAALLFLVVCNELRRPMQFQHCGVAVAAAVALQSAIGLIQYFTHARLGLGMLGETDLDTVNELMATSVRTARIYRVGALMIHPNIFGIFLAVTVPLCFAMFLARTGRLHKLVFLSAAMLGVPALIVTFSRSSWVSFAAASALTAVLVALHSGLRRRAAMPAALVAIGLAVIGSYYATPILARILESKAGAMTARAEFKAEAWTLIEMKPWQGWGLNSYAFAVAPFTKYRAWGAGRLYQRWVPVVHNTYLLWWAETGLIGLALHVALLGAIIWTGVGNLRTRHELMYAINAACMAAMFAFLIDGINSPSLRNNPCMRVFWVLVGMIVAVRYWRLRNEPAAAEGADVR